MAGCTATPLPLSIDAKSGMFGESHREDTSSELHTENSKADAFFTRIFEEQLALSPMSQSYLGRKTNQHKWDDLSPAHAEFELSITKGHLKQLNSINPELLDSSTQLSFQLQKQQLENLLADYKWRYHGYPVNQMFGTHSEVASLLINQHRIDTHQDAFDYISRLNAAPKLMLQLVRNLKVREQAKINLPQFVIDKVINDCENLLTGSPFDSSNKDSTLYDDFKLKIAKANLSEARKIELIESEKKALLTSFAPAYKSLIDYLTTLKATAPIEGGAWQMPDGESWYNNRLKRITTTDLSADQIHIIGLSEVDRIHREMEIIKNYVNFKGNLKEFFNFMRVDPQFYYVDSEVNKERYLLETQTIISAIAARLPSQFKTFPKADLTVKAVEEFREKSTGNAFYEPPSPTGDRPGIYYVNMYNLKNMPLYQMEALAYHEALPGHHLQLSIAQEIENLPLFRRYANYAAYSEGWGLYAELLAKEIGFYQDPYSDFGRLSMELWRASRLVVDTGLHAKKWSKQQAIDYLSSNTPNPVDDNIRAVERYLVMPGQATAYKIGMLKILELRQEYKQALGDKFDVREFHELILRNGALPLDLLTQQVKLASQENIP
jgi:uncharacterized protein (DUF885 family)